jgi:hypothetical protein
VKTVRWTCDMKHWDEDEDEDEDGNKDEDEH